MIDMLLIFLLDLSPLPFNFLARFCVIKSSSRILQKMQLIIWFSSLHFTRVEINISKSCASRSFYFIGRDYGLRRPRREAKTHGDWNLLKLKTVLQSYGENYLTGLEMTFGKQLNCYVMCWNQFCRKKMYIGMYKRKVSSPVHFRKVTLIAKRFCNVCSA